MLPRSFRFSLCITIGISAVVSLLNFPAPLEAAAPLALATLAPHKVVVPDQFNTIQAAINSGADTVLVRSGTYPESLVLDHGVFLLRHPDVQDSLPDVDGITLTDQHSGDHQVVDHLHAMGPLQINIPTASPIQVDVIGCMLDRGITAVPDAGAKLLVQGCTIGRPITLTLLTIQFRNNHLVQGGITVRVNGTVNSDISNNLIEGPADAGIRLINVEQEPVVQGNTVTGCIDGIVIDNPSFTIVQDNVVQHCTGHGIRARDGFFLELDRNRVGFCGGQGFDIINTDAIWQDNVVDSVGLSGIHVAAGLPDEQEIRRTRITGTGGHGIHIEGDIGKITLEDNAVHLAQGDGVLIDGAGAVFVRGNVIGRCVRHGLAVVPADSVHVYSNTVYLNQGSGFELTGAAGDSIDHNVSYGNSGFGLNWLGAGNPRLRCNDWFGNRTGATAGTVPHGTDLDVDPQFCDLPNDSVHLSQASPVLNAPGCGLIGARGQGCVAATAVPGNGIGSRLAFAVQPTPARDLVHFSWPSLAHRAELSVYDVSGAKRWGVELLPGATGYSWSGVDERGRKLAPGTYYATLRSGQARAVARVILIR